MHGNLVTVLPWCCPKAVVSRSTKGAKAKTSNLLKNLDACENLFKTYQELASLHGTSENIHEANHGLWNVRLLAYHFATNAIPNTQDALTSWAYQSGKGSYLLI